MSGGGSQKATQSSTSAPWKGQQPYLMDIMNKGQQLYNSGAPKIYQGNRVAPFSGDQLRAQQGIRDFASPTGGGGQTMGYLGDVVGGKYLDAGNPHFSAMASQIAESVIPNVQSAFESSGRYGGGADQAAVSKALSDQIGALAFQNYGAERGYQQQAAGMMPGTAQQILSMLSGSGQQQQGQQQNQIQAIIDKFNETQNGPAARLGQYQGFITGSGNYPSTQTTSRQPGPDLASQLLSGLLGGASLAGSFGAFGGA